jgi:hypothetical protein
MSNNTNTVVHGLKLPPKAVGSWIIGGNWGLQFTTPNQPIWLHKKLMKLLLGIEWKDL